MASFQEIDAARKLLGLGERASLSEIKEAYRRKALECHPDRRSEGNKPDSEEMIKKINAAYKLILTYCEGFPISFQKEEVEMIEPDFDYVKRFYSDWFGKRC